MKKKIAVITLVSLIILYFVIQKQGTVKEADFLEPKLQEIEAYLEMKDSLNTAVSKAPVAWHLDHSLKVINGICDSLLVSDPKAYSSNFSATRLFCFTFNYIPRGRAKAPKRVQPPAIITTEAIKTQLETSRTKIQGAFLLDNNANIKHPFFKQLDKGQSLRFIQLHTEHHLKIVRDILKK